MSSQRKVPAVTTVDHLFLDTGAKFEESVTATTSGYEQTVERQTPTNSWLLSESNTGPEVRLSV